MTALRRPSALVSTAVLVAVTASVAWGLLAAASSSAFTVESRGTAGLDGKVVMSPAAERIETIRPDGGEQIAPGSTVKRAVILHNRTKDTVDFDLVVSQVVGSDADLVVEVRDGVREGAAAWVTLDKPSFSLKPGQQATVGVTIRIPKSIKPGSKPFAVTATQRAPTVQTQGAGIAPQFKQVAIFIVELPGDAPVKGGLTKAVITSAQKSLAAARDGQESPVNSRVYVSPGWTDSHRLTLSTQYVNEGERLLTPTGKVVVRDLFDRIVGRYDIKKFTVYPEGESAGQVELKGLPSLGVFTTTVELTSEAAGTQKTTLPRFVLLPKWLLAALAAFAIYGIWRLVKWRLRRRREWKAYLAESDDDADGDAWEYDEDEEASPHVV